MPRVVISQDYKPTEEILSNKELMAQVQESDAAKKKGVKPWKIHL